LDAILDASVESARDIRFLIRAIKADKILGGEWAISENRFITKGDHYANLRYPGSLIFGLG